jgi:hypothetical protein
MPVACQKEKTGNKMPRDGVSNGWKKTLVAGKNLIALETGKIKIIIANPKLSTI